MSVPVELRQAVIPAPLRAQTLDIGLGGCYVEMTFTQDVAAEVEITLWINETKIRARAVVVSSHPSFGNGLKFTSMAEEDRERLKQYLESLQPSRRVMGVG